MTASGLLINIEGEVLNVKKYIIDSLINGKKVMFYFDGDHIFSANTLIDPILGNDNFIFVGQKNFDRDNLINLSKVTRVRIPH